MKTKDTKQSENATPTGPRPADFPIGSPHSRAAARKLAEDRVRLEREKEPWRWVTIKINDLKRAKALARLFRVRGGPDELGPVKLIDGETGAEIPY
jgi:hypothetical protein